MLKLPIFGMQMFAHLGLTCQLLVAILVKTLHLDILTVRRPWPRVYTTIIRLPCPLTNVHGDFSFALLSYGNTGIAPQESLQKWRDSVNNLYLKEKNKHKPKCLLMETAMMATWCLLNNDNLVEFSWLLVISALFWVMLLWWTVTRRSKYNRDWQLFNEGWIKSIIFWSVIGRKVIYMCSTYILQHNWVSAASM